MKTKLLLLILLIQVNIVYRVNATHLGENILIAAKLDGAQEVPVVSTNGQGVAGMILNGTRDTLCVSVSFNGLSGPLVGAHIHDGLPGVGGPILVDLTAGISVNLISATLTGVNLSTSILSKLLKGECYINLHTAAFPNGEIRGQLYVETDIAFPVLMTGAQEVPAVSTTAYGAGYFNLSKDLSRIRYFIVMQNLSAPLTAAHLHAGQAGVSGGVIENLTASISGNIMSGEIINPSTSLIDSIIAGAIYVNVHNGIFPSGEIRGQLINSPNYLYFDAQLNGAQEVPPAPTVTMAAATIRLNTTLDTMWVDAVTDSLTGGTITGAHFHLGDPGVNGPVVIDLMPFLIGNRFAGIITDTSLTPELISDFLRGGIYMNIHTTNFPGGEIRGQVYRLAREGYTVFLNGDQETPPVITQAEGAGIVSIAREQDNAHFMIVASGISASDAHFHNAAIGQPGPVIYSLASFYQNGTIFGYWKSDDAIPFNAAQSQRFESDSVYVNLHTTANPGGEIRGQVLRGFICQDFTTGIGYPIGETELDFSIYPNPVSEILHYDLPKAEVGDYQLVIYNSIGQIVRSIPIKLNGTTGSFGIQDLTSGLYQIVITGNNGAAYSNTFQKF